MIGKQQMVRGLVGCVALTLMAQACGLQKPGQSAGDTTSRPALQTVSAAPSPEPQPEAADTKGELAKDDAQGNAGVRAPAAAAPPPAPTLPAGSRARPEREQAELDVVGGIEATRRASAGGAAMK